jgi:excinuclease ABC subunit A
MYTHITVKGAREHNLKNIDVSFPKNSLVVLTGLSGSGKSTLAFDTIYAEGQRRYVESLSAYARQFLGVMQKPDVDSIDGLSPAISIEQKTTSKNPRSTVGTVTEIYDYLRLLYARVGIAHCPICQKAIAPQTTAHIVQTLLQLGAGTKIHILSPVVRDMKGTHEQLFADYLKKGFSKVQVDNAVYDLESPPQLDRYKKHSINIVVARLVVKSDVDSVTRLTDAIETGLTEGSGLLLVDSVDQSGKTTSQLLFNKKGGCTGHPQVRFEELQPRLFSFNSPFGACADCHGLGVKMVFDPTLLIDYSASLIDGCVKTFKGPIDSWRRKQLLTAAKFYSIDVFTPFGKLPEKDQKLLLSGTGNADFEGIITLHNRLYLQTESEFRREELQKYMIEQSCTMCNGKRLKPESLSVYIGQKNIIEVTDLSIHECFSFFEHVQTTFSPTQLRIARLILKEILDRLRFLINVGLGYLSLSRSSGTLSGGEAQRIRLATQIGSNLTGVLYVLDEPSIGLHQKDNDKLIQTLLTLKSLGNTVLVVEHDADTMRACDYLIDMGPGAGIHGGSIMYAGPPQTIPNTTITGAYLTHKKTIPIPSTVRTSKKSITIHGACEHNLRDVTVHIPLGIFVAITGVSGSGKSTLINHTLVSYLHNHFYHTSLPVGKHTKITGLDHVDKIISIDQSPIGKTPRSNPVTYTKVFTEIRELYAQLPESKSRGYDPGRFSFNVPGGRCETCQGDGVLKIEMNFLPDVYVPCEACKGARYDPSTLDIRYKGKSISDVLHMSVEEALVFFENFPSISQKLQTLVDVGLGYITLGQSATTLSGGEAQRIKLTAELAKRATGKTIYILDEPTTGLHFEDVRKLLEVLNRLVDKGNSVIVIEHNLDVIKSADYIIDLGPDGGSGGGTIVAQGTPAQVAKHPTSYTGHYLAPFFQKSSNKQ